MCGRRREDLTSACLSRYSSVGRTLVWGGLEAASSSLAISTTADSAAITSMFRCKSGPAVLVCSSAEKTNVRTTAPQVCGLRGELSKSDEMLTLREEI